MAKKNPDTTWSPGPHEAPVQLADNLWRVAASLPSMDLGRCMVVARLTDGDLVIHNGVALDDAGMAWLEGLGRPAWLVVPNGWHRLDAARYAARFPGIKVLCPPGARRRVTEQVAVDLTYAEAGALDDTVSFEVLDGVKGAEGVMRVRSADGVTLVLNDAVFNLAHGKGVFWFIYGRLMRNAGKAKVTSITRLFMVKQRAAFKAHLQRLADTPDLRRVIVAHGAVIDAEPSATLRAVADGL